MESLRRGPDGRSRSSRSRRILFTRLRAAFHSLAHLLLPSTVRCVGPVSRPQQWGSRGSRLPTFDPSGALSSSFGACSADWASAAIALTQLLHKDLTSYGTDGQDVLLEDDTVVYAIKAHRAVLARLGLEAPEWPFKSLAGFHDYWRRNGMYGGGGWQARREYVESLLGPTRNALEDIEEREYEAQFTKGPKGDFKNLIFASTGPKPEIILRDAVNNDVEIVRNREHCLIYSRPLHLHGLTWQDIVSWWQETEHGAGHDDREAARGLWRRLNASLASPPERVLFDHYTRRYAAEGEFALPALIPRVYLHYDPYRKKLRGYSPLERQRMDFLLLMPDRARVVIEVDGVQHYAHQTVTGPEPVWVASPRLYGSMVAEDRRLRLDGYEVHRFGGWELKGSHRAAALLSAFFDELIAQHTPA